MRKAKILKILTFTTQQVLNCALVSESYHCRVSCVCFFLSFIICVMVFF